MDAGKRALWKMNDVGGRNRSPNEAEWNAFRDALARELPGQPVVRRYSGGGDAHAACGMLASRMPLPSRRPRPATPDPQKVLAPDPFLR